MLKTEDSPILKRMRESLLSFSPIHYEAYRDGYEFNYIVPNTYVEKLTDKGYWIIGPHRKWWHPFVVDQKNKKFTCFRNHVPGSSNFAADILFYDKSLIFQKCDYIFILWKEPTPQFHALPLSKDFFSGQEIHISDSGILCKAYLQDKSSVTTHVVDLD